MKAASTLSPDITFELIPDCEAATAAGYDAESRARAQLWYPPVVYGKYFYYTPWEGSILSPVNKSSLLICRKVVDGELVYARNCADYSLDTAPNYLGNKSVICRPQLCILDNVIYLCNAVVSNPGPQLFAIDAKTGNLNWAAAYYPPEEAGSDYITKKGDYSFLSGLNNRLGDLSPSAGYFTDKHGKKLKLIFVGSSSFQNAINYNIITGGFPVYTDCGQCVCIVDHGDSSSLYWRTSTCAPLLKLGDVLKKNGPVHLDPFRPNSDKVVLFSVTSASNNFIQPYYLTDEIDFPDPVTPIVANALFEKTTVINSDLVQKIWSVIPRIYIDANREKGYTLDQLLTLWKQEQQNMQPGERRKYILWSYVTPALIELAISQKSNYKIGYFKFLLDGQKLEHLADVSGLNYWGNSTWGAPPTILEDQNLVVFGTGQGHDIPWDESLFYSQPSLNFKEQKKGLIDMVERFITGHASIDNVNLIKRAFVETNKIEALNVMAKSPRGRMSYSDGILGINILSKNTVRAGEISFALRSVPWDNYSFLTDNPQTAVLPIPALDGDVPSGIHSYYLSKSNGKKTHLLSTTTKAGIGLVIDISGLNESVKFDHSNLSEKGVTVPRVIYNGPNAALGGSNYLTDVYGNVFVSSQANTSWFSGSSSTSGILERQVTPEGKIIPINSSFIQAFDITTGEILWETPLGNRSVGELRIRNGIVYTVDAEGNLYCLDIVTGDIIWKYNGKRSGLMGGITCPVFSKDSVIWTNNYNAFGLGGSQGPNGVIFRPDPKLLIKGQDRPVRFLNGRAFASWDSTPKFTPNPAINPEQFIFVSNVWSLEYTNPNCKCSNCEELVCTSKITVNGETTVYKLVVDYYNFNTLTMFLRSAEGPQLTDAQIKFLNKDTYVFEYTDDEHGKITAWMEPVLL